MLLGRSDGDKSFRIRGDCLLPASSIDDDRLLVEARDDVSPAAGGEDASERLFSLLMLLSLLSVRVMAVGVVPWLLVLFTLFTRQPVPPLMLIRGTLRMFSPPVVTVVIVVVVDDVVSVEADVV